MAFELYFNFVDGKAEEALHFYERIFEGKRHPVIMRYKNMPNNDFDDVVGNYVLHAELTIENIVINFSDVYGQPYTKGTQVSVMYTCKSSQDVLEKFNLLSVLGSVVTQPGKTFFAESYCQFTDQFGIPWELIYLGK